MLIIAKEFTGDAYGTVQDHFVKHWEAIGSIREMMMIAETMSAIKSRIIILLPNNNSSPFYDGFERISESQLPKEASLLVGYQDDFERRFSYPTRL